MIITVKAVRSGAVLGKVKVDDAGKAVEGDEVLTALVTDVVKRAGVAGLKDWTNGYVQLKAA
jgi:hypothetical protein